MVNGAFIAIFSSFMGAFVYSMVAIKMKKGKKIILNKLSTSSL